MIFRYAARKHKRNNNYQVWILENHAVELDNNEMIDQMINYIHENQIRAGWVTNPEDYLYSSARSFAELDEIIKIDTINGYL